MRCTMRSSVVRTKPGDHFVTGVCHTARQGMMHEIPSHRRLQFNLEIAV